MSLVFQSAAYAWYRVFFCRTNQGSQGREKGWEFFFLFPTLKRSGKMIFFNKVGKNEER